ncbi:glycine betaine/proline transport system substrate-binding protein [Azospirillum oryzae]|uniref:Glycine betaine/proline transport system substrate-binding protein n=1 Tax=Azospirillum oryzae TaxID=286727 RepID=A0A1X7HIF6_9PROT|nr:choline ABC transporter substrate-binding protein [Azospirillum oryzae]SMF87125.1 glycine betaine/proline transport system substrate-binding protein [Azospirillum oryzae]
MHVPGVAMGGLSAGRAALAGLMTVIGIAAGSLTAAAVLSGAAAAAEPANCQMVRMADPGWTDITATNAVAGTLLGAMGYQQKIETVAVPIIFQGLKTGQIDVFLGNWMPAQSTFLDKLIAEKTVEIVRPNLENAKFTLAVPTAVAEAGVHSFADLAKFGDRFEKKIYGIEPGAPANQNIQRMLDKKDFGLEGWTLVESSEQAMLAQAIRRTRSKDWVVFLGWQPHPMNTRIDMTYLSGGDAYFGPNYGSTTVNTLSRRGYGTECPNVHRLFSQLAFTVGMENEIMAAITEDKKAPKDAAAGYLKAHPDLLGPWLAGVSTRDGKDAAPAVRAALGLK